MKPAKDDIDLDTMMKGIKDELAGGKKLMDEKQADAIREAFMETSRGRWFLGEYAKRNRNADTHMVLDAVARIEQTLAAQKQARAEPVSALAEQGRLVVPVGDTDQWITIVTRTTRGVVSERTIPVRFVPLVHAPGAGLQPRTSGSIWRHDLPQSMRAMSAVARPS